MKKSLLILFSFLLSHFAFSEALAEDGSRLWLRYDSALVSKLTLQIDPTMPDDDGYRISGNVVTARTQQGLL